MRRANYRKNLTETSNSTVISNRSSRCKIQLSNETEELIPDILQLYISLVLSGSEKHIVSLIQSTMYLLPEAILTSNGQRENILPQLASIECVTDRDCFISLLGPLSKL